MDLIRRPRRLRNGELIRNLVKETRLDVENLIYPLFVVEGTNVKKEIKSLPGNYHYSVDRVNEEIGELHDLGIKYVMLFGIPENKDAFGSEAYSSNGVVQRAIKRIKEVFDDIYIITDICMCQYTEHGHCGILCENGYVDNDETLKYLGKIAISHVEAGADMVAPSDMMDGRIGYIRRTLDEAGYVNTPIMSYSAKYVSAYYGPFREAAHSAPSFGDRKAYQMDPANSREALIEAELDIKEGADILMVKPALAYLDVIRRFKDSFNVPIAAYSVSGEYSMLKLALQNGLFKEDIILETTTSIKRAGADIIITYFAKDIARMLKEGR
ncbi:porphobilinogen synthase [Fonticella tunisiensis]|uniref:Delta-aminolevulinic acid dehydratase n=1 Tax=Fonticella tunisiensis TaxID=1096341 RepID=A0A4R7KNP1_9CLOT|nr:porphobilinogen synthase [Fonticella tunisiensis]TDT56462.1 porphobilinogen synthase [Fonticella tunisiensis]